jgi:hypothetical protein
MSAPQFLDWHDRGSSAAARDTDQQNWYRMPIVWLAAAVALTTLGGCILMVVLSLGAADRESSAGSEHLLGVPVLQQVQEQALPPRALDAHARAARR